MTQTSGRPAASLIRSTIRWAIPGAFVALVVVAALGPATSGSTTAGPARSGSTTAGPSPSGPSPSGAGRGMLAAANRHPTVQWTSPDPANSPPPLTFASEAYDPDTSPPTVVLFGGVTANGTLSADTWTWNGQNWTDHPAAVTSAPPSREMASMAFDESLHQMILFGGQGRNGALLSDTWAWNGASWYQVGAAQGSPVPAAREAASLSYEPGGGLLLFGGTGYVAGASTTPTTAPAAGGSAPGPGGGAAGGGGGTASVPPAQTAGSSGVTVLGDTWVWTGQAWQQMTVASPPARSGASMAWDPAYGAAVLFGGESSPAGTTGAQALADTWVWNGAAWSHWSPPASDRAVPPPRWSAVMAYAPAVSAPVLLGGGTATTTLSDAWLWTTTGWMEAAVVGGGSPRQAAAAAYDAATASLVVFGGTGPGGAIGDTGLVSVGPAQPTSSSTTPTTARPATTRPPATATPSTRAGAHPTTTRPHGPPTTSRAHGGATGAASPPTSGKPAGPVLEASVSTARRGTVVRLVGRGFAPGSHVTLTFHSSVAVLLGQESADSTGTFVATVAVPASAAPGQHRFVATGDTSAGTTAAPAAPVLVMGPPSRAVTLAVKLVLVGLALLIPLAAWLSMVVAGWWRRRRRAGS